MNKIAVVSIFYNTNFLLESLYGSFIKNSNISADFFIFDNSTNKDKQISSKQIENKNITIEYLQYDLFNKSFGSKMHCMSIQFAFDKLLTIYDYLILLDSDVIITGDLSKIIDTMDSENYDIAGWHDGKKGAPRNLIHPSFLFVKTKNIIKYNIKFFDENRIIEKGKLPLTYDTGMSFYEDVLKNDLRVLELKFNKNYNHFGCGSRAYIPGKYTKNKKSTHYDINTWLSDLYEYYK